jgi:triacylglycerol lipase
MTRFLAAISLLPGLWIGAAAAQEIPPQVAERIKEIGPVLDPKMLAEMFELYAPLMPKAPENVTLREDLAYGTDERHRLDVFAPAAKPAQLMPVVVFVHGAGYVDAGTARRGIPFYRNVGYFFARNGVVAVNMAYRLAPKDSPAGGEDVAAALRWVKANIRAHGGDPNRIVLYGQSSGATHVAHYVFDESLHPTKGTDGVKGAILQSGVYESFFRKLRGRSVELFLIDAELDPEPVKHQTEKLRNELCKLGARGCPRHMELAGHNHISEIVHLNTSDNLMGSRILDFVRRLR